MSSPDADNPKRPLVDPLVTIQLPHSGDTVDIIVHAEGRAEADTDVQLRLSYIPLGGKASVDKCDTVHANPAGYWSGGVVGEASEPNSGTLRAYKADPGDGQYRNRLTLDPVPDIGFLKGRAAKAWADAGARVATGKYDPTEGSRVVCMLTPFTDDSWILAFPPTVSVAGTWLTAFQNPPAKAPPYTLWVFLLDAAGNVTKQHTRKIK